jgi:hypothetical protein
VTEPPLSPSPSVICKDMGDGAVLFCSRSEVYFGLNDVGVLLWNLLSEHPRTVADLVELLHGHFPEQGRTELEADVREFIAALEKNELVLPLASSLASASPAGDAGTG